MESYLLKAKEEQFERWRAEAERHELSLAAWLRQAADFASGEGMFVDTALEGSRQREGADGVGGLSPQIDPAAQAEPGSRSVGARRGRRPAAAPAPDSTSAAPRDPVKPELRAPKIRVRSADADGKSSAAAAKSDPKPVRPVACAQHDKPKAWCAPCREATAVAGGSWA